MYKAVLLSKTLISKYYYLFIECFEIACNVFCSLSVNDRVATNLNDCELRHNNVFMRFFLVVLRCLPISFIFCGFYSDTVLALWYFQSRSPVVPIVIAIAVSPVQTQYYVRCANPWNDKLLTCYLKCLCRSCGEFINKTGFQFPNSHATPILVSHANDLVNRYLKIFCLHYLLYIL